MKLKPSPAPYIHFPESNKTMMSDVILVLCVLTALATLFYGPRVLLICGVSVAAAVVSDLVCVCLRGRVPNPLDFSPVVTGMIIALAMPATVSFTPVITASVFAIVIVKHPFGGTGSNIFNPAAAGFSFAVICWPQQIFNYPMPFEHISLAGQYSEKALAFVTTMNDSLGGARTIITKLYQNPAYVLKLGGVPTHKTSEMLVGNFPGAMGATSILVLVACLAFLVFRRTVRWQLPFGFLGTCMAIAWLFPRCSVTPLWSVLYEMMSGILLFGAVFMLNDPTTRPKRAGTLFVYGVFAGLITMLLRYWGGFEESVSFAILLANAFVPTFDRYGEMIHFWLRRKRLESDLHKKTQNTQPLV